MSNRRSFIKSISASLAGIALGGGGLLSAGTGLKSQRGKVGDKVYIFSKHLQWLGYHEMSQTARELGFDGVDLTVRPGGHVLPQNCVRDLPLAVKEIQAAGLLGDRMTTAITDPDDPLTFQILKTASELGITSYRLGWFSYDKDYDIQRNIEIFNLRLKKLADLNEKFGLKAAYQNHTGEMAGGLVWDIGLMLEGINPEFAGVRYDIRHATAEGGHSWPLGLKYLAPKINSFDVKDFIWKEADGKWIPFNVPLGEGMVDFERFFSILGEMKIKGDFTLHLEYPLGGAENGSAHLTEKPEKVLSAMKKDLTVLREMISGNF